MAKSEIRKGQVRGSQGIVGHLETIELMYRFSNLRRPAITISTPRCLEFSMKPVRRVPRRRDARKRSSSLPAALVRCMKRLPAPGYHFHISRLISSPRKRNWNDGSPRRDRAFRTSRSAKLQPSRRARCTTSITFFWAAGDSLPGHDDQNTNFNPKLDQARVIGVRAHDSDLGIS